MIRDPPAPEEESDGPGTAGLPVVDGNRFRSTTGQSVAGMILAAGESTRYGRENKLLARIEGESLIRHSIRPLLQAGLDPVLLVVGHEADRVASAVADLPVEIVVNARYADGQATSIVAGIEALDARAEAVVIALGDMPGINPSTIEALVGAYAAGVGAVLAPTYGGHRGNPVLFDRRYFDRLRSLSGDSGARSILLGSDDAALVAVDDPGIRRDVDRPADLDR